MLQHLLNSTVVATDGTFSIAPSPFMQLTSFVFFFTNVRYIRKAFCGIHVLFTSKTSFIYNHLLTKCISGKNERRRSSARKEKKISKKRGNDHAT